MRLNFKKIFPLAVLALLAVCLLTACANDDVIGDLKDKGYVYRVTFDFCGGTAKENSSQLYYVQSNSLIFAPGTESTDTEAPILNGHHVKEYYVKETAADGTEIERTWNFDTDRVTGDVTLYCRWATDFSVQIRYGEDNAEFSSVKVSDTDPTVSKFSSPRWSNHTLLGFYYDAEYTTPVTFPYVHAMNDDQPVETVYAKFIEGTYTVVTKASDLRTVSVGGKYYLMNDIDMSSEPGATFPDSFSGEIIGNGHVISNLTVEKLQTRTGEYYGLFNSLTKSAILKDVTFENLKVTVTLGETLNKKTVFVGLLAGGCDDATTLENVKVAGELVYDYCGREDLGDQTVMVEKVFGEASNEKTAAVTGEITVTELNTKAE